MFILKIIGAWFLFNVFFVQDLVAREKEKDVRENAPLPPVNAVVEPRLYSLFLGSTLCSSSSDQTLFVSLQMNSSSSPNSELPCQLTAFYDAFTTK